MPTSARAIFHHTDQFYVLFCTRLYLVLTLLVGYCYGSELQSEYICCSKSNHHINKKFHFQSDTQVMQHRGILQGGPLLLQQLFHRLIWDHILLLIRNFVIEGFDLSASHLARKSGDNPSSIYSWFLNPLSVLHSRFPTKKSWVVAYFFNFLWSKINK